jgi:O-Antigen ligase
MPIIWNLRGRLGRANSAVLVLALLTCGVFIGLAAGRVAASHYGPGAIGAIVAAPALIWLVQRPGIAFVTLMLVVSTVFSYSTLPRVSLPGHPPINLADLTLLAAVGGTLWRRPWETWTSETRRFFVVLAAFLVLASISTIKTALTGAVPARESLLAYRNFLYLGIALTIALELSGQRWRAVLNFSIAFAGCLSVAAIVAAASPSAAHELQRLNPITVYSSTATTRSGGIQLGDTSRVRLTGLFFIYSMLAPTLVMITTIPDRWRRWRVLALLLMLAAVGLSLNRNMFAGAAVALLVTALLGGAQIRARLVLLLTTVVLVLVVIVSSSVVPAVTAEIGRRAGTILNPSQVLQSNSAKDRQYELSYALPSIGAHPWLGVGPRQFYGAYLLGPDPGPRFFVQNLYVDLATDYGIPTALAFILIPGLCLWYAFRRLRWLASSKDRALLAAFIGSLVAILMSCFVDVFGQDPSTTIAIGTTLGFMLAASTGSTLDTIEGGMDV